MELQMATAKEMVQEVTNRLKKLEKFVFKNTNWEETLANNNRLGRRLLMAIKEHSRPDMQRGAI